MILKRTGHQPGRALHPWRSAGCGLLLLASPVALAESGSVLNYGARVWQTDEGLPLNPVWAIAQTLDGYLWVGTQQGLARFDGLQFAVVDDLRAPELKQGWITSLCPIQDGGLWIACDGQGVIRLKDGKFSHLAETNGLPSNRTRCLLEASDGSLWIGSEEGLTQYREGKFTHFGVREGLGDLPVRALFEDGEGTIQAATRRGLSTLSRDRSINTRTFEPGWNANSLRAVWVDRKGKVWAGSNDGLHRVQDGKVSHYGVAEGLPDRVVNCILEDGAGQLWLGTYGGLVRMVDGKLVARETREGVYGDLVNCLFEDREGNLWAGARDGLYQLKPERFRTYTTEQGLGRNNVMSVCEDRTGTMWMATWGGGLSALRDGQIATYTSANSGLTEDAVLSLLEGRDGSLWIGMDFAGGLNQFKGSFSNSFARPTGLINAPIRVMHEDREGALWVGTSQGLNRFTTGRVETFTANNGLAGNAVLAICEDDGGVLWFGTDRGLSRWDGKGFHNYTTRQGLSHEVVDALYLDREKALWIGTRGGGLNRLKAGEFGVCTTREGLFSDEIYEIVEDDFGYFWMSCRKGIFRVARLELEVVADRVRQSVNCVVFSKVDGLLTVQCNGVAKPAGWKARDGRIWFPTIRGAVAVETRIESNPLPPPVVIEAVFADGTLVGGSPSGLATGSSLPLQGASRPLTLPPGQGQLEINYTALSFQASEKNRFKYMLEGVDARWRDAGAERSVRYNTLAPGSYRFRVIACNNDGVWNDDGATLALVLQPHFWQTWWFKLAGLVAVALIPLTLYRLRVKRLRAIESLRIQIAADLHDDVGARLTKVAMVTESLDRTTPESADSKPHIRNISVTTREIVQAMDEIVWTINPKNDTLENLASYLFRYAQDYFQNSGVRCRVDVPTELPEQALSTQERHNLFMAVKEALNNVLKHARATEVRLGLAVKGPRLTIQIADNGCGFSPDQADPSGNGLKNMRQRLERIGGRLVLESQPGAGTHVTMEADAK